MAIDRIKYLGLLVNGEVLILKAGKLKYRAIEEGYKARLIDGTNVYDDEYFHIEFTLTIGYLLQQHLRGVAETALIDEFDLQHSKLLHNTEVDLSDILDDLRAGTTLYPLVEDQHGNIGSPDYEVLLNSKNIDLFDAKENGRFPMYTTIKLITKDPLTAYPSWINR